MSERQLISAIKSVLPEIKVYHDFAPESAKPPFVLLARVGGAGRRYFGGDATAEVRMQISVWADGRIEATALSLRIADALCALPEVSAAEAAVSVFNADTSWRGMRQDFMVLEQKNV